MRDRDLFAGFEDQSGDDRESRPARAGAGPTVDSLGNQPRPARDEVRPIQRRAAAVEPSRSSDLPDPFFFCDAPPMVQARSAHAPDAQTVHAHAARGVEGSGAPLPHLAEVQRAFGPAHDLTGVRAHVGGAAADAATAIGAQAYTTGADVAFAATPDLHLVAHEAAHVVQQRAGVHLAGGVGAADDPYERHADAVADVVVAGGSAAALLAAGPSGGGATAVQRQAAPVREQPGASAAYLATHWDEVRAAVRALFAARADRWGGGAIAWGVDAATVADAALELTLPTLYLPGALERWVDAPDELIAGARAVGATSAAAADVWNPAVGRAIAREVEDRLALAVRTMAAQYARAAGRPPKPPRAVLAPVTRAEEFAVALLERGQARVAPRRPAPTKRPAPAAPQVDADGGLEEILGPALPVDAVAPGSELRLAPAGTPLDGDLRDAQRATVRGAVAARGYAEVDGPGAAQAVDDQAARFDALDADEADPAGLTREANLDEFVLQLATLEQKLDGAADALFASDRTVGSVLGLPWVARAEALARSALAVADTVRAVRVRLVSRLADAPSGVLRQRLLAEAQEEIAARVTQARLVELTEAVQATLRDVEQAAAVIAAVHSMIVMVGLSLVAAHVGAAIQAGLLAALARTSAQGAAMYAGQAGAVMAGQLTEAALNAAFQTALLSDDTSEAFAENLIGSLLAQGVTRGMRGLVDASAGAGMAGGKASRIGVGTLELAGGAGAGFAGQAIARGGDAPADAELAAQGALIVVSHWLTRRLSAAKARLATRTDAEAHALTAQLDELLAKADQPLDRAGAVEAVARARTVLLRIEGGAGPEPATAAGAERGPAEGRSRPPTDGPASTRGDRAPDGAREGAAEGTADGPRDAEGPIILAGDDAYLRAAAARVQPLPGYLDVVVHGDVDHFGVVRTGETVDVDHRALARYLARRGLTGQKIRLIACEAGRHPKAVAQHLANKLDVEVLAPSDTAWIAPDGTVGVGARDRNTGTWITFAPKESSARSRPIDPLAAERAERFAPDGPRDLEPVEVFEPRVDRRARAAEQSLTELATRLGAPVVIDDTLTDGVRVTVRRVRRLVVDDLVVERIHIGRATTLSDLLTHQAVVAEVERYNGALGALRRLRDRFLAWRRGQPRTTFPHGSRAWQTELELTKLRELIDGRALATDGAVDRVTLAEEVAFLDGRRAFHAETLTSLEDAPSQFSLERPDTGQVTAEALARGYRLPDATEGVVADWYYYRHRAESPDEFELARKASAPVEAPQLRARVVAGQFTGFERPAAPAGAELPADWTRLQVAEHLRQTVGFQEYALMLESHGLASRALIDGVVGNAYGARQLRGKRISTDDVRHAVKDHFRPTVLAYLLDPSLDDAASLARMSAVTRDLPPSDSGVLTEAWHVGRKLPGARRQVPALVERTSGDNAGKIEKRRIDAVDGTTAVEIKSGASEIDPAQLDAYLDMLRGNVVAGPKAPQIKKVRYVFTDVEGAKANLPRFAMLLDEPDFAGRLVVEYYTKNGKTRVAKTADDARAALHSLGVSPP